MNKIRQWWSGTDVYRDISGQIKVIHIFFCSGNNPLVMTIDLQKSNLEEHGVIAQGFKS